ncbi:MAG: HAD-IIA family hydrolase [Victivallaceae bacterium]
MTVFNTWWKEHRRDYDAILFDIDGTLIAAKKLLPGADELLAELRREHFPFYLLTNDGNHSTEEKSVLMAKAGLHVSPDEIVSCSMALKQFAEDRALQGKTFFIMGDLGVPCYTERAGLKSTRDTHELDNCAGVIVGEGFYNWHDHIQAVFNFLKKHPERPLVVPNPDSYWPSSKKGEFGIGAGAKARFICGILAEMGIVVEPVYLGKPFQLIYEYTLHLLKERFQLAANLPHERIIMLGDSLQSDIKGANQVGITSGLMLTGITTFEQAEKAEAPLKPDYIFETIG